MKKAYVFLADGFEEIEGLTVVDVLRRAGAEVEMVSVMDRKEITGAHGIKVEADRMIEEAGEADLYVLPGGMPGNMNNLMKQAQRMQRQMEEGQKELEAKEFSAKAGGGAVEVTVSGKKEVLKVQLSEEVVDPDDIEMLQDLIMAATNEALRMAEEANNELMGKMTGGLGGGFPF